MLNEFDVRDFCLLQDARRKVNEAHEDAVEIIVEYSGALDENGDPEQPCRVLDEVDSITEVLTATESLLTSFLSNNKEEWKGSSDTSSSRVRS